MTTTPARERLALNTTPLILRLMLGVVILWSGLAKLMDTADVQGDRAATLANMGLMTPPAKPPVPTTAPPEATPTHMPAPAIIVTGPGHYSAADFPEPVKVQRMYLLAVTLHDAAFPKAADAPPPGGPPPSGVVPPAPMPTWHPALASGPWPLYFAWGLTVIEVAGGASLLIGLLTRFWALGIFVLMAGALWLSAFGPAIQGGHTRLGFFPDYAAFDSASWHPVLYHFLLMMSALALALSGPGRASLDRMLFGPGRASE